MEMSMGYPPYQNETDQECRARLKAGMLVLGHENHLDKRPCCLCEDGWTEASMFGAFILDRNFDWLRNEVCDRCVKELDSCLFEALIAGRKAAHQEYRAGVEKREG
jgi:hypothetical protein